MWCCVVIESSARCRAVGAYLLRSKDVKRRVIRKQGPRRRRRLSSLQAGRLAFCGDRADGLDAHLESSSPRCLHVSAQQQAWRLIVTRVLDVVVMMKCAHELSLLLEDPRLEGRWKWHMLCDIASIRLVIPLPGTSQVRDMLVADEVTARAEATHRHVCARPSFPY